MTFPQISAKFKGMERYHYDVCFAEKLEGFSGKERKQFMDSLISILGYVGIIFILLAYFMLILGHMKVTDTHYIMLNTFGALFVIIAMHNGVTLPLFYTVVAWLLLSIFGYYKHRVTSQ